ncbi:Alkaline phosphatase synthesis sensor protein phoR [Pannonibacter phragmitetus]|uniref:histidine kinase n=1 Tax=Pannonibacter phragmitetus TaxID=121719 RepID=A0A378ZRY2_9HYPH|nr:ATP-binding protein [Pannonibacter phragmitetus]SUB00015.1 Alkaline phosphatase synthesis sensor protein phoR [Pannonibacter phragmitetus]
MTDTQTEDEKLPPRELQARPSQRLKDARWVLFTAGAVLILLWAVFRIPLVAVLCGFFAIFLAAALGPRRSDSVRALQLENKRDLRRMWPGTGIKVTADALPMPCFIADGRGITRYVNTLARDQYPAVRPGDPISFGLRTPSLLEAFDRARSQGTVERIEWAEKVPTESWFEASIAPIYLPSLKPGQPEPATPDFLLVALRDLTEQRRLERMRTDFVANASHELRTPLASLTGFIETLQGPAKDDARARERFLGIMLEQANRMRRLIDDILSLSRIELKAHVRPDKLVDLREAVHHTNDALSPLARELGMEVHVEVPEQEAVVRGDRDELIQVTENLVENALKYGSTGKRVDVSVRPQASGQGWVLTVRDYGEGISSEHLPRLTERFYRVDVASSRAMKGTGLGLAIVKHILTRHRARLDIESQPGQGAAFSITFPADGQTGVATAR